MVSTLERENETAPSLPAPDAAAPSRAPRAAEKREAGQARRRLVSLDAFRGLTVLGMQGGLA